MRINNETSSRLFIITMLISLIVTFVLVFIYTMISASEATFLGFFKWFYETFQVYRLNTIGTNDVCMPWLILLFVISPYIGFFISLILKINLNAYFDKKPHLKYINLLSDRIEFFFTKSEYNIVCAYSDVQELNMNIESTIIRTKCSSDIVFKQLNLTFSLLNGKIITLSNTTLFPLKQIYRIIDYTRNVKSFAYKFSGYGEIPDYKEKIIKYRKSGYKDILGRYVKDDFIWMSLLLFILGIIIFVGFVNLIDNIIMLLPLSLFFIISFIFDIFLVIDENRDNSFKGYKYKINTEKSFDDIFNKNIFDLISAQYILIFKAIIILFIIWFYVLPLLE